MFWSKKIKGFWSRKLDGVLVRDADKDLVGEADGVLVREDDAVLEGEADEYGFSSSMIMGLEGGNSSTISSASWILVSVFGKLNRTLLGFFPNEKDSINESLYVFFIS